MPAQHGRRRPSWSAGIALLAIVLAGIVISGHAPWRPTATRAVVTTVHTMPQGPARAAEPQATTTAHHAAPHLDPTTPPAEPTLLVDAGRQVTVDEVAEGITSPTSIEHAGRAPPVA